jgi:sucrose-6-phosphate hydrolase SacC (GH32 family)
VASPSSPRPPAPGPLWDDAEVVLAPADPRPGAWVGGPSALLVDGVWWLAYRMREPVGEGRGIGNVVARSDDGVTFTRIVGVGKDRFGAESLERPALVRTADGRWRLYVSCATPGTKHWRVDLLEADTVEGLATAESTTVLPGSDRSAVKDPVIRHDGRQWHLWASVHPLDDPEATDRMTTEHATSTDGVTWTWQGTALAGTPGTWDARGVRFATVVLDGSGTWALYDGRATAQENWEERTGLATQQPDGRFAAAPDGPLLQSPHAPHGLRYADVVPLPGGGARWFYEATRPGGAHELRTVLLPG